MLKNQKCNFSKTAIAVQISSHHYFSLNSSTHFQVFTALALVNILIGPLNSFPWVLNGLVEALVSIRRLEWFFGLKNMELRDAYSLARG